MLTAFEITYEDVQQVLKNMGTPVSDETAQLIFNDLDMFKIEVSALYGNDLETQTEYAYIEIRKQITDMKVKYESTP